MKLATHRATCSTPSCPTSRGPRSCCGSYFPPQVVERFDDRLDAHPLHREIVTTTLVNDLVNWAGSSFVFRAVEETGADAADVVRAYAVVRDVFGLADLWQPHLRARRPGADRGAVRAVAGVASRARPRRRAGCCSHRSRHASTSRREIAHFARRRAR